MWFWYELKINCGVKKFLFSREILKTSKIDNKRWITKITNVISNPNFI